MSLQPVFNIHNYDLKLQIDPKQLKMIKNNKNKNLSLTLLCKHPKATKATKKLLGTKKLTLNPSFSVETLFLPVLQLYDKGLVMKKGLNVGPEIIFLNA
ncbi:CLUMA_CG019700, isoform A [Clunio marinus]|uniref:CLUMA_CG019700, isoform A n=1 Tax=Clunio marinus TaxID=568069 RepID=A0A1J1J289_9DIPT|nr:CLUMA_CG019700, isoform A [Clunio marinus]